uniref:DUF4005 domain-containing protein n=1 Tax=Oryza barthii TaxID=65489 RepID=A0A0D3ETV8_9ORYZ
MGRIIRWLKKLLTGRKEAHKGLKENHAVSDGAEKEKSRWSFAKHRRSGVDSGRRPSEAALAAVAAVAVEPSEVRRPCHCGEVENAIARREKAAMVIQKAYRGYLARKALRALRSLVKLQALVRGYLVRKQAATTLHRLQALMRLQASSRAATRASYRKSMEQERISVEETRLKTTTPGHRRRLSDSADSNYERSPRIVEMDTCHRRSRSSRIAIRHSRDHSSDCLTPAPMPPAPLSCSSPISIKQPPRLSIHRSQHHERDTRHAKTAHNTRHGLVSGEDAVPERAQAATGRRGASEVEEIVLADDAGQRLLLRVLRGLPPRLLRGAQRRGGQRLLLGQNVVTRCKTVLPWMSCY